MQIKYTYHINMYTNLEKTDMLYCFIESGKNSRAAAR